MHFSGALRRYRSSGAHSPPKDLKQIDLARRHPLQTGDAAFLGEL
jgi:hypothetical protein